MEYLATPLAVVRPKYARRIAQNLQGRADDVLISIAVLGLVASLVDGQVAHSEINHFSIRFRKQFALSRPRAFRLIMAAVKRLAADTEDRVIEAAFDCLNEQLDLEQKLNLFDGLVEIIVSDRRVLSGEEEYLDYVAVKLNLVHAICERYPEE